MMAPPSSRSRLALASIVALAGFSVLASVAPTAAPATIKLGVFNRGAPANAETVADYTATVGRQPEIVLWYRSFGRTLLSSTETSTLTATAQSPILTWEPYSHSLWDIAGGAHDPYLLKSAQIAASWGGELMIRFAHEMNGDWYPWTGSPSAYVAAWHHIVTVFREAGATNVRWVWSPNVDRTGSMPFSAYFPGDEWVDYIGLDGYNWGATEGNRWSSLKKVFASSYATITQLSAKPLIIAETSSSEIGGDKAAWIRNGFMKTIPQDFPRVIGVVWFNASKEDDWRIASSQRALDAYREVVNCYAYGGSGPCDPGPPEPLSVKSLRVTPRVKAPARRPRGAVSYRLSNPARVRIEIQLRKGRGFVRRVALVRGSPAGPSRVPLRRLIGKRKLPAGSYRVTVIARGDEGQRSRPRRAHFRII
jgi:Glycosyl hydrolase family 26